MARFIKTKKEEIGISPYTFLFRGDKKSDNVSLNIIDYNANNLQELEIASVKDAVKFNDSKSTTWLNINGLHDEKFMEEISHNFDLEPNIISQVMNTHARPRFQEFDNCIYISLKMLDFNEAKNIITSENLVIIIKQNILLSFQEIEGDVFDPLRDRLRKNNKRLRIAGTDYLAFALMDIIFDNYTYIISCIGDKIESLEIKLLDNLEASLVEEINSYKKEIIFLSKNIKPCLEITLNLLKSDSELLKDSLIVHLEELKENIVHTIESLESYREILSDQVNIYHTTMSSRLNDIVKFLTMFSVIFIPLTFIVGVYGTNFDFLPEKHYKYSYFIMWAVMILIALFMIKYFKRKKWL